MEAHASSTESVSYGHTGQHEEVEATVPNRSQPEPSSTSSSRKTNSQSEQDRSKTGRWIRLTVSAIKAVLFLELASLVAWPLIATRTQQVTNNTDDDDDSDLDPADVLMDYLTGRTGLAALQLLRNDQLKAAVNNLITEDYEELGVKDRGQEIRNIIDDIIKAREKGVDTPISRSNKQRSSGLGRMGPVKFRNTKQALAREVSPPTKAEAAQEQHEAGSSNSGAAANADSNNSST